MQNPNWKDQPIKKGHELLQLTWGQGNGRQMQKRVTLAKRRERIARASRTLNWRTGHGR